MTLKAIIFDVDGTIAETEEAHRQAFNAVFKEYNTGWHWDLPLYRTLLDVAGGKERLRLFLSRHHPSMLQYEYTDRLITQMHRDKTARYLRNLAHQGLALRPGVLRLLTEARSKGVRLAIATTTYPVNVTALLRHAIGRQAADWFEVIVAGDQVERKKPHPDIYETALERLGLPPEACIAIEDSRKGMLAALGAGVPTVVTRSAWSSHEDFTGAQAVISDLGEPGRPFTIFSGESHGAEWVDVGLLRRWHAAAIPPVRPVPVAFDPAQDPLQA
ncbi:HAD-IA family hydrolase [Telmatospirillum sp. J64-1]|uniref:HAD-IA family hydrolase n=1 Tax=Telmatospirillum sp. J64-1 TaxID=2502183 RepID=UPI00115F509E|nr:HAD-IA family hydrolase [Telmatospirillum sp. J64-1]